VQGRLICGIHRQCDRERNLIRPLAQSELDTLESYVRETPFLPLHLCLFLSFGGYLHIYHGLKESSRTTDEDDRLALLTNEFYILDGEQCSALATM